MEWFNVATIYGSEDGIYSLCEFNNKLYAGTYPNGNLLEYDSTSYQWIQAAPQYNSETKIWCLVVFNNKLYGGGGEGYLLEWNGTNSWVEKADAGSSINSLYEFNGKLYGAGASGKLYEWNGTDAWIEKTSQYDNETIESLCEFNEKLYGGTNSHGYLLEWDGTSSTWIQVAPQNGSVNSIPCLIEFNNKLYGGTASKGNLLEWDSTSSTWIEVAEGPYGIGSIINSLVIYNNSLYGSYSYFIGENSRIARWNETDAWVLEESLSWLREILVFKTRLYATNTVDEDGGRLYKLTGSISLSSDISITSNSTASTLILGTSESLNSTCNLSSNIVSNLTLLNNNIIFFGTNL